MRVGTTVQSRQLGRHLKELRKEACVPAEAAAHEVGMAEATIYRYEAGQTVPKPPVVKALCELYEADPSTTDVLVGLAREAETPGWWRSYNGAIPKWFDLFVSLEQAAGHIRAYDSGLVPGLLQTRKYAEAIIGSEVPPRSEEERGKRVAVRLERQRILTRRSPVKLDVILGEAALLRVCGGRRVMAEQLRHLDQMSRAPNVTIRILPLDRVHGTVDCGSRWYLLTFPPSRREPPLAYLESLTGAAYLDQPTEIMAYENVWSVLWGEVLSPPESRELITSYLRRFQ